MRPTVASLGARSGHRSATSNAIRAFPAHGISRRTSSTRLASAIVHCRPGWLFGRLLRGTRPLAPSSRSRRLRSQYVLRPTPSADSASGASVSSTRTFR